MKRSISLRNAKARAAGPRFLTVNRWALRHQIRGESITTAQKAERKMVRGTGFEPAQPFGHKRLRLTRLPVPPSPHWPDAAILPPNSMRKHRTPFTEQFHAFSPSNVFMRFLVRHLRAFSLCVVSSRFLCASSPGVVSAHLLLVSSPCIFSGGVRWHGEATELSGV